MAKYEDLIEENISQEPAIKLLESLGYKYMTTEEAERQRGNIHNVILKDVLRKQLYKINEYSYKRKKYKFDEKNIKQAVIDINEPLTDGLVKTNEKIYDYLMLGRSYQEILEDGNKRSFDINYIDWKDFDNNEFHVVEEFSVERTNGKTARPDLVLFVNGIPFAVIECKRSSISIDEGISQTIRNQGKEYIPHLFKYVQLVMAINKNEAKYATCNTPKKFWAVWREENTSWLENEIQKHIKDRMPTVQDKNIIALLSPHRLLELAKQFIVYDKDVKKVCRYQQYFAVKEIMNTIKEIDSNGKRQGGAIWHTQGSGKSITMVMLAKYILSQKDIKNAKVVVVTDRKNLDKQIRDTFSHTRLKPSRAETGAHLIELLQKDKANIVTTIINKFNTAAKKGVLNEDNNIFVLVDESHRGQYGDFHNKMKDVFPKACYLGFTGTPLMKKDKNTMIKFGKAKPIHTYTIADGVRDGAIVPLLYEGKMVEQSINQRAIDNKLEMITRHLNDKQKEEVMKKWSRFEKVASSNQRLELIAFDINQHYIKNYKCIGSQFKGMLATNSKSEAIKYKQAFEDLGDLNVEVVISKPDDREGHDEVDQDSKDMIKKFWQEMMNKYGDEDNYEESLKNEFKEGDEIDLLIVVDKLLTGFDAPKATVLYVDKPLKEHTLLQAIARVNRLHEGKDYGYIIDYRGLLDKLDHAMNMYTGAGLEKFDPNDLKGALQDVKTIIGELRQSYSDLTQIFSSIKNDKDPEEYEVLLGDDKIRENFYDVLSKFGRNVSIAIESEEIYKALGREELDKYKKVLKFYQELRKSVKLRYSDGIDHKEYEAKMQNIMDNYIAAETIMRITNPVDILDEKGFELELERLNTPRAKADAIRTRIGKSISKKYDENPAYYKKFSERIQETIDKYRENRISEAEYFNKMEDIMKDFRNENSKAKYPDKISKYENAKALYGEIEAIISGDRFVLNVSNLTKEEREEFIATLALDIDNVISRNVKTDWYSNLDVHNRIEQEIDDLLFDFSAESGIKLEIDEIDEIIEKVKKIALRRY